MNEFRQGVGRRLRCIVKGVHARTGSCIVCTYSAVRIYGQRLYVKSNTIVNILVVPNGYLYNKTDQISVHSLTWSFFVAQFREPYTDMSKKSKDRLHDPTL